MQCLPKSEVIEFNADTLEAVRKTYNLHKPGDMSNAVDILDAWIKQQNHFIKKEFDRDYLERKIISCKGSVERAKERLDRKCTYLTLLPQFFGNFDAIKESEALNFVHMAAVPKLTDDNLRICMCKVVGHKIETTLFLKLWKFLFISAECFLRIDYNIGFIAILDAADVDWMDVLSKLQIDVLRQGIAILLGGYDSRLNAIHIYTNSNLVDMVLVIVKKFISAKLGSRIYVHNTLDNVFKFLPNKDILPEEYGGKEKPLAVLSEEWKDFVSAKKQVEYLKEMYSARTDESLRQTDQFNDMYMGTPGTFRAFNVD